MTSESPREPTTEPASIEKGMRESPLLCWREGPVARIRFNRPAVLNAVEADMAQAFLDACSELTIDPTVRVIVIDGAGRAFMAGGDVAMFRDDPGGVAPRLIDPLHEALRRLGEARMPVVASLHGAVAGAGMSLALACDLAIAAEGTRFAFAYTKLGASCDLGASWHLPRLVGLRRALGIALVGDTLDASTALQLGLVNRVVPDADLAAETDAFAARLVGATAAQGELKRLLRESLSRGFSEQLDAERGAFQRCMRTHDYGEGVAAFLDKRAARFEGG